MVQRAATTIEEERQLILSRLPPSPEQKRLAFLVVVGLFVVFVIITVGLPTVQLPEIKSFIPAYGTAMFVTDAITAALLFAQFSIVHSVALLAISSGYVFTACVMIPWMLTFPHVFAPSGLLGAGLQSTAWLYILWHAGFPLFVTAYALLNDSDRTRRLWRGSAHAAVLSAIAVTAAIVAGAVFAVTAGNARLPSLMLNPVRLSPLWYDAAAAASLLNLLGIAILWLRRQSILDLWLMVVLCAYIIEMTLISFPDPARYSLGWYSGRVFGLLSSSLILFVLLYETTTLYARLLGAVLAQRREREARLMTGDALSAAIAHEVRQPLSAITTFAEAGLRWLDRATPDIGEAKAAMKQIATDGHRAAGVIEGIRASFRTDPTRRSAVDINALIKETLLLVRTDLQNRRILVETELAQGLAHIQADGHQLQQVILNLISNSIDSLAASDGVRVLQMRSNLDHDRGLVVSVEDNGPGIDPKHSDRLFNPLFTTKRGGMGMGLCISRSIVEAHGGQLWIEPNRRQGAAIHFALPADGSLDPR